MHPIRADCTVFLFKHDRVHKLAVRNLLCRLQYPHHHPLGHRFRHPRPRDIPSVVVDFAGCRLPVNGASGSCHFCRYVVVFHTQRDLV